MAPYNHNAAKQYPFVANDTGYSPVANLLEMARGKPTTSAIQPVGPNPMDLLQGLGGLQSEMQNSGSRRFSIVRDRMNEALRQAEEDALQRRMDEQNRLIAEQNKLARVQQQTPSYTGPFVNTGPTNTNNLQPFPQLPTDQNKNKLIFPEAQTPKIAPNTLPFSSGGKKNMTLKDLLNMGLSPPKGTTNLNAWLQNYMTNKNKKKPTKSSLIPKHILDKNR